MPAAPPILGSTGSTTFVLVALLVLLGIAMLVAAAWLLRATRTDTQALAPLEVMGDRRFVRRDADTRAAVLAGARPEGAIGPAPMVEIDDVDEPAASSVVEALVVEESVVEAAVAEEPGGADEQPVAATVASDDPVDEAEQTVPVEPSGEVQPVDEVGRVDEVEPVVPVDEVESVESADEVGLVEPADVDDVVPDDEPAEATPGAH